MRRCLAALFLLSACAGEPAPDPSPEPSPPAVVTPPAGAYPALDPTTGLPQEPLPASEQPTRPPPAERPATAAATPTSAAPAAAPQPPGAAVVVTEAVLAEAIVDRAPSKPGDSFAEGGRVYLYNRFTNPGGQRRVVEHVWFHGDDERNRIELTLKAESWRTWSYSTVYGKGAWRVEVRDRGTVIDTQRFTVR